MSDWRRWLVAPDLSRTLGRFSPGAVLVRQVALLSLVVGMLLLSGCFGPHADQYPQTALEPTTEYGRKTDVLWQILLWAMIVVFVLVEGILVYTMIRFRARPGQPRPRQTHGNTVLEISWTIIPVVLLVLVGVPTVQTTLDIGGEGPADAIKVDVIGHQWWWEFYYRDLGIVTANELVMPVNRNMRLDTKSDDVVHSFWLPRIGGKRDANPNHPNHLWFDTPKETGVYLGQCAEYCGTSHAYMRARGYAVSEAEWNAWVEQQKRPAAEPTSPAAQKGKELFAQRCAACHNISGVNVPAGAKAEELLYAKSGKIGPNLTHVGSRKTIASALFENNTHELSAWLKDAPSKKAGAKMPNLSLSDDEIAALVSYLQGLK